MVLYYLTRFRASEAKFESESGMCMIPVEVIERMIDDFRTRIERLEPFEQFEFVDGGIRALEEVIRELRKVVDDYGKGKQG